MPGCAFVRLVGLNADIHRQGRKSSARHAGQSTSFDGLGFRVWGLGFRKSSARHAGRFTSFGEVFHPMNGLREPMGFILFSGLCFAHVQSICS